ncbi:integration host factor subunit beta [Methylomonas sp. AM2-LC]|uniref:integration host factor subunit beta n=1 Tax=Methylomonas sp. AM2-LC TaxID=3153301 RepID=UPI00326493C8
MTKSELIGALAAKQAHLLQKDVELAVNTIIDVLTTAVATGDRIEIRGFGGFSTIPRKARIGRNPKTGEPVSLPSRHTVHFKPGLDLRNRVNASKQAFPTIKDL